MINLVRVTHEEITGTNDLHGAVIDLLEVLGGRLFMDGDADKADRCKRAIQELRGITPNVRHGFPDPSEYGPSPMTAPKKNHP